MDRLEALIATNRAADEAEHAAVMNAITSLRDVIGHASHGDGEPAKGMFHLLESLDKRVRPFEGAMLQMKGGLKAAVPIITVAGVLLWFLAGDRITMLFHG